VDWYAASAIGPPGPPVNVVYLNASGTSQRWSWDQGWQHVATITFDRAGQWLVAGWTNCTDTQYGINVWNRVRTDTPWGSTEQEQRGGGWMDWNNAGLRVVSRGHANVGQTANLNISNADSNGDPRNSNGYIEAWFIPTTGYPS
jgi:hypothetical protein